MATYKLKEVIQFGSSGHGEGARFDPGETFDTVDESELEPMERDELERHRKAAQASNAGEILALYMGGKVRFVRASRFELVAGEAPEPSKPYRSA